MTRPQTLPPQYTPARVEPELYRWWMELGVGDPDRTSDRRSAGGRQEPFVIVMPPPNVTDRLHMGHGLNLTIQDTLIRFERMRGRAAAWIPGTDHAGIATQNVVERQLARDNLTRFDLGRDEFVRRVTDYVAETGSTILQQIRALGASCDWSRTYYTMSDELSRAVRETFVSWYERDLIYRGKYIINWCPRCLTALSNEEAEKEEVEGRLWHLRYPLEDGTGSLVVATTRPETMLGDTAVAVHPADERYHGMLGRHVRLPLADRLIPVVADPGVDPAFGTGAVKVTPAHDSLDFEIADRQGLPALDVMTPEARMADTVPERFRGLDRSEARRRVVAELETMGLVEKSEPHRHAIGHCYRCGTVVEPRLSDQWFVRMAPLARPALAAYREGRLRFVPERWGTVYAQWMEEIRDWCISRQLWWGHRIPVWYCDAPGCGRMTVSRTDVTSCPGCGGPVRQDEDVLDTWFSSQLVPFSSLGWPDPTEDLQRFYPGHVLVTGPDIIFFWVARMVMSGLDRIGALPFTTVFLTGIVRDTQHRKMSKSLGNGIDPLEVIERYGADALRYTVLSAAAVGTDVILDPDDLETSFAAGRNFANKLWNIGRFILSHLDGPVRPLAGPHAETVRREELSLADRWLIARCDQAVRDVTAGYEKFRLNEAVGIAYRFVWDDLADWYLELAKPRLHGDQPGGDVARAVLARTFEVALRLLHPAMPFITETLGQQMGRSGERSEKRSRGPWPERSLSLSPWPHPDKRALDPEALAGFARVQEMVAAVRSLRAEYALPPGRSVRLRLGGASPATARAAREEEATIRRLAKVTELSLEGGDGDTAGSATVVLGDGATVSVPLGDLVDLERECRRLGSELERLAAQVRSQEGKLSNQQFVARAPGAVVNREREKLASWQGQLEALREKRRQLGCPG